MAGSPDNFAGNGEGLKNPAVQRGIILGVLVVAGAAFAGIKFFGNHDAGADKQPVAAVASVHHVATPAAPVTTLSPAPTSAAANNVSTQTASAPVADAPVVRAVPQNVVPVSASQVHLDDHVTYQYNALGRRDPFQSLVDGQFVGVDVGGDAPPDPGGIKVVGIVWGANDQFALVEDVRGNSFVLRKGDKVQNGVVEGLKRDGVIVNITAEGQSQSVVIPLVRKGDTNAR